MTEIWRWESTAEDSPSCESMDDDDDDDNDNDDYDEDKGKGKCGKGKCGKGKDTGKGKTDDKADKDTSDPPVKKKRKSDDTHDTSRSKHKGSSTDKKLEKS